MNQLFCNGWSFRFQRNIHTYCHSLTASKQNLELKIPCEDTPDGYVGIWPYGIEISKSEYADLLIALRAWANTTQKTYRLYLTCDEYESNFK